MDTGIDGPGGSEDASASFGDTESTDQFIGVAIKGNKTKKNFFCVFHLLILYFFVISSFI